MPLYEFECACGVRHTCLTPIAKCPEHPECPACGSATTERRIGTFHVTGRASPGPDRSRWPRTWEALDNGNPETIARWRKAVDIRLDLERRHPEFVPPSAPPVPYHEHQIVRED